ncbi:MAG: hypothetical protein M1820_005658 [Bogoriella megaspora]|nr:MAG: hypothetical protein M1820_005658 [Bogoriella megaspora]
MAKPQPKMTQLKISKMWKSTKGTSTPRARLLGDEGYHSVSASSGKKSPTPGTALSIGVDAIDLTGPGPSSARASEVSGSPGRLQGGTNQETNQKTKGKGKGKGMTQQETKELGPLLKYLPYNPAQSGGRTSFGNLTPAETFTDLHAVFKDYGRLYQVSFIDRSIIHLPLESFVAVSINHQAIQSSNDGVCPSTYTPSQTTSGAYGTLNVRGAKEV